VVVGYVCTLGSANELSLLDLEIPLLESCTSICAEEGLSPVTLTETARAGTLPLTCDVSTEDAIPELRLGFVVP
jgi:hypothetical protein